VDTKGGCFVIHTVYAYTAIRYINPRVAIENNNTLRPARARGARADGRARPRSRTPTTPTRTNASAENADANQRERTRVMTTAPAYGAATHEDVLLGVDDERAGVSVGGRRRALVALAATSCVVALATYGGANAFLFGIAPDPKAKPVPATATYTLDAKCIDGSPVFGAHRGFFTATITGASVVKHNYGTHDFFEYGERIPMQNLGGGRFTLTTSEVDWEWSFVLENSRGEFLYEAGGITSALGRTSVDASIPLEDKKCIQKYGKYFNRVRTIDISASNPTYTFGTCEPGCPPPPHLLRPLRLRWSELLHHPCSSQRVAVGSAWPSPATQACPSVSLAPSRRRTVLRLKRMFEQSLGTPSNKAAAL